MIKNFPFNLLFFAMIFMSTFVLFESVFWLIQLFVTEERSFGIQGIMTLSILLALYGVFQFRDEDFKKLLSNITTKSVNKLLNAFLLNFIAASVTIIILTFLFDDSFEKNSYIILGVTIGVTIHSFLKNPKKTVKQ